MLSHRLATLHELQTVYGIEDMYVLLEVMNVDAANQNIMLKRHADRH